ncbi:twitching motility protein PilT [Lachnoanaerobaculum umeaense]|uniref:Twitching motility protein PilT n=1 Tax=Lachnoanaerobaculum umeaense TaxID=617123 RepID=A0A385Q1F5_9FIRM|nr:twitching motility protein PilT [Lachnoanaerobaculum umeaense]AYA99407.1 twitching motility protein PilT [Lachnoanaerobaculum umeaense]PZW99507.1 hypothetical protein C7439_10324 [Lachnoanaerobaculum umeaense]
MVSIIAGEKGKGKTKILLEKANEAVLKANGSVIYLDKSSKHMYELNNKIRLINVSEFPIMSADGFIGFLSGLISSDHDIEAIFLDSFLKLSVLEGLDITSTIDRIETLGEKYGIEFVLSVSMDVNALPENAKKNVTVTL